MAETRSPLERLLNVDFSSDTRQARFALPGEDDPDVVSGKPTVPVGRLVITREVAYDIVVNRIFRKNQTPPDFRDDTRINRDVSLNEIIKFAREKILPGKWDMNTPKGMDYTPDGYVLDGQHRSCAILLAYILAAKEGISFAPPSIPVTRNVPWSSFSHIDTGLGRQGHQFLSLTDPKREAVTLKYLSPMLEGREKVNLQDERADIDRLLFLESLFPEMGSGWYSEVVVAKNRTGIPAKTLLSHMIAAYRAGAEYSKVQEFLNPLIDTKIVLEPSDPRDRVRTHAYRVRNERNRNGTTKISKRDEVMYANLIRAGMRNFLDGKQMDKLAPSNLGLGEIWHGAQLQQWYKEMTA